MVASTSSFGLVAVVVVVVVVAAAVVVSRTGEGSFADGKSEQ